MEVVFRNKKLQEVFALQKKTNKYPFPDHIIRAYVRIIYDLMAFPEIKDFYTRKSWHFKTYKDCYSIRVSDKYRIELDVSFEDKQKTYGFVTILEFSNYYDN